MPVSDRPMEIIHSRKAWRTWLAKNHQSQSSVWVVCNTQKSNKPTVAWTELVDEAICFGWIDSTRKTIDETKFKQLFSKRKPRSTWSKINKEKIKRLTAEGLMMDAGFQAVKLAKQNGSWTILDEVEKLAIPADLEKAFTLHPGAKDYFMSLSKSIKKMMLQWIVLAKKPETRQNRINEIAILAGQRKKPKQF
ncbi:MAG TPA: YdeI/OmpD-associated family protein [Chitinophagaceae bacterium]|nr:YdeI/OmpD-associated family protein [Chitinophagaceae bacterium]